MKILGLTTSGKYLSVAVTEGTEILSEKTFLAERSHSVLLLPTIIECLEAVGLAVGDLDGIAVDVGPGSYTGIRIGISAAMGLAFPHDTPVCGVSSLEAAAYGCENAVVMNSARGSLIYTAVFSGGERLTPDSICDRGEFADIVAKNYSDFVMIADCTEIPASRFCFIAGKYGFYPARELRAAYLEPTKAEKDLRG